MAEFRKSNAINRYKETSNFFKTLHSLQKKNDKFTLSYTQMQKYSDVAGQNQFCDKIDTRQKH